MPKKTSTRAVPRDPAEVVDSDEVRDSFMLFHRLLKALEGRSDADVEIAAVMLLVWAVDRQGTPRHSALQYIAEAFLSAPKLGPRDDPFGNRSGN